MEILKKELARALQALGEAERASREKDVTVFGQDLEIACWGGEKRSRVPPPPFRWHKETQAICQDRNGSCKDEALNMDTSASSVTRDETIVSTSHIASPARILTHQKRPSKSIDQHLRDELRASVAALRLEVNNVAPKSKHDPPHPSHPKPEAQSKARPNPQKPKPDATKSDTVDSTNRSQQQHLAQTYRQLEQGIKQVKSREKSIKERENAWLAEMQETINLHSHIGAAKARLDVDIVRCEEALRVGEEALSIREEALSILEQALHGRQAFLTRLESYLDDEANVAKRFAKRVSGRISEVLSSGSSRGEWSFLIELEGRLGFHADMTGRIRDEVSMRNYRESKGA